MIQVCDITKQYDKITALYGISFTLNKGDTLGILGLNGAGKSTLLNILSGGLSATSGSYHIDEYDYLKDKRECRIRTGYMPEKPPLYMDMKVGEYLSFACELKKTKKRDIQKEVLRIRQVVGFDVEDDALIIELSDFNKRKLSLCQALAGDPPVLLLDDPARELEGNCCEELLNVIKEVAKGKTVIYASRNLMECTAICDNVIIINRGRVAVNSSLAALSAEISDLTRIKIRVQASRAVARNLFTSIKEITDIELQAADEKGATDITVTYPSSCDLRAVLWKALQTAGVPALEMKQLNISLEDIYLQMSGER